MCNEKASSSFAKVSFTIFECWATAFWFDQEFANFRPYFVLSITIVVPPCSWHMYHAMPNYFVMLSSIILYYMMPWYRYRCANNMYPITQVGPPSQNLTIFMQTYYKSTYNTDEIQYHYQPIMTLSRVPDSTLQLEPRSTCLQSKYIPHESLTKLPCISTTIHVQE